MKNILSILLVSIIMLGCGENNNTNELERVSIEKLINKGKGADPSGQ